MQDARQMRHTQRQLGDTSAVSWILTLPRRSTRKSGGNRLEGLRSAPRLFVHSISNISLEIAPETPFPLHLYLLL
jgi:hypothetical protein